MDFNSVHIYALRWQEVSVISIVILSFSPPFKCGKNPTPFFYLHKWSLDTLSPLFWKFSSPNDDWFCD